MKARIFSKIDKTEFLSLLKLRFEKNMHRHKGLNWSSVETKLLNSETNFYSIFKMEETGGEPDVVGYDKKMDKYVIMDCSQESPDGRRSLCYDKLAWDKRKENKPKNNAVDTASEIGIEVLNELDYSYLQSIEPFDLKTSSWLETPIEIREKGGAIFGDFRFGRVFIYHNSAESYYAARGFRGKLFV